MLCSCVHEVARRDHHIVVVVFRTAATSVSAVDGLKVYGIFAALSLSVHSVRRAYTPHHRVMCDR